MTPIKLPVLMTACLFIFTACTPVQTQAGSVSAASAATTAPDSMTTEQAVAGIVWPTEDYAALDEEGQEAYRQAVEEQLALDEYVLLPDGSVAENPETGRYDPRTFLETFPEAQLLRQQVEDYILEEVQAGFRTDPVAKAGDNTVRRYDKSSDNLQRVTLVYRSGNDHMNVCFIGLQGWPEADGAYTFEEQALPVAEEDGRTVYSLSGKLDGNTLVQLNGTGTDEQAFAAAAAAFVQAAPELLIAEL